MYTYITTGQNERGMTLFEPRPCLADRAIERQAPVLEEQHTVADLERQDRPLLGQQHGRAAVPGKSQRQLDQPFGRLRVELRGRLVEQQQLRLERQRRGEADPLQLPAGQRGDEATGEVLGADRRERLECLGLDLPRPRADVLKAERDLVENV